MSRKGNFLVYNPLENEIFLPIPLKIAQRKDLKNLSKMVYGYLLKCFGKDGLVCPSMAVIAKDLNVSRQIVSKCVTELKNKGLINIIRTGKANQYEFNDVNTVVTSDVNTVVTSPIIKEKEKEKIKKLGASPDFSNYYLDELMELIPKICKPYISRKFMNECLKAKNYNRSYFLWLFDKCIDKPNQIKWLTKGMREYYAEYLRSEHYQAACAIDEFKHIEAING